MGEKIHSSLADSPPLDRRPAPSTGKRPLAITEGLSELINARGAEARRQIEHVVLFEDRIASLTRHAPLP